MSTQTENLKKQIERLRSELSNTYGQFNNCKAELTARNVARNTEHTLILSLVDMINLLLECLRNNGCDISELENELNKLNKELKEYGCILIF
jgi:uncharacterized coiled-coil DUF342 family protein